MKRQFFFSPNDESTGGADPSSSSPGIPRADVDLHAVAEEVGEVWAENPHITLVYITQPQYMQVVSDFETALTGKMDVKSGRSSLTGKLKNLNNIINEATKWTIVEIKRKFRKDAPAEYARYGIVKVGTSWSLPKDNDMRLKALSLMQKAVKKDGYTDFEYNEAFWKATAIDFKKALTDAKKADGAVSAQVAPKNVSKALIRKVHISLRKVIEGNYPDTYQQVWREWGWQKEKY